MEKERDENEGGVRQHGISWQVEMEYGAGACGT